MGGKAQHARVLDTVQALVAGHLSLGQPALAAQLLLPALDDRADAGDQACRLAALILRQLPVATPDPDGFPPPPDPLSRALERMMVLVQRQEEQLQALQAVIEEML